MKLISCSGCAVVLDVDRFNFPDVDAYEAPVDEDLFTYVDGEYVGFVWCPVCDKVKITEEGAV